MNKALDDLCSIPKEGVFKDMGLTDKPSDIEQIEALLAEAEKNKDGESVAILNDRGRVFVLKEVMAILNKEVTYGN